MSGDGSDIEMTHVCVGMLGSACGCRAFVGMQCRGYLRSHECGRAVPTGSTFDTDHDCPLTNYSATTGIVAC